MKQLTLPQKAKILKALHYIYLPSKFTYTEYSLERDVKEYLRRNR